MKHTLLTATLFATLSLPVQAAEIPDSATLQYSGSYGIPATMSFKRHNDNYTIVANINVPFYTIRFESSGKIVGTQLYPSHYKDTRNGKTYASAQFSGNQVTYGRHNSVRTETVSGRVMDLFTLSWQLAFEEGKLPSGINKITNGKKLYPVGGIQSAGSKVAKVGGGKTNINQFTVKRGDDTVLYAFAPALGGVPAIISYHDGDNKYNLTLKSVSINGQVVKP
ncbi:MAG: DUF3108 domain-containing protein [Alysiella sp.]|uniref:DUF3108 domain-containing protein n=1 Tax=Alysiella sp. TaxID=1872483 RepID=UPI0026DC6BC5|nr:DUF3108 domain-containing protein [Alysiella sp.]MDO4434595.1 DUF3108 domain-containing protein [Alysiella sp.]